MTEGSLSEGLLPAPRRTVPVARLAACAFLLLGLGSFVVFQSSLPTRSAQPEQVGSRSELMLMKKSELAQIAKKTGVADTAINEAWDADDQKAALVALIMATKVLHAPRQVSPVASVANQSHLRPLDLVSDWGDSQCWRWTGGTCLLSECDDRRKATCESDWNMRGSPSQKCMCEGSCVDASGSCTSQQAVKVASGFKLRNVYYNDSFLTAGRSWFGHVEVVPDSETADNLNKWALWKQPGLNSNNETSYFLALDDYPKVVVGLKGLGTSKLGNCMEQWTPEDRPDPAQLLVQPCRPAGDPGYIEFHYQDVVMRSGYALKCAEGWAHAVGFGRYGWWKPEPQFDIDLPKCTKSWSHYVVQNTVVATQRAYNATFNNQALMSCLQNMSKKWTIDGLMDEVIASSVNPTAAPQILLKYLQPMVDSLIDFMSDLNGGECRAADAAKKEGILPPPAPAPAADDAAPEDPARARRVRRRLQGDDDDDDDDDESGKCHPDGQKCMYSKYKDSPHSSCMCLLGCWVDMSLSSWPEQIPAPVLSALDKLASNGDAWGPLACLSKNIVDPALKDLIKLLSGTIKTMLRPIWAIRRTIIQHLPYGEVCFPHGNGDGDGDGDEVSGDFGDKEDAGDGAAAKKGRRLQASVDVAQFFGGAQVEKFWTDTKDVLADKLGCIVQNTFESDCLSQMKKQVKKGKLGLEQMDASALFFSSIPKILHIVLHDYLLGDFMADVIKPALDFFKGKLSMLFTNGAQAVTGVAGLIPEVGGAFSSPVMATIGSGFVMIVTHIGDFLFGYIKCVLSTLFDKAMAVVKKFFKPIGNWLQEAKAEVIAWLKEKYQYLVPIMNKVFDHIIPLIAYWASPKLHSCLTFVYEASGGCPDKGQCRDGSTDCDPDEQVKCCLPRNEIVWKTNASNSPSLSSVVDNIDWTHRSKPTPPPNCDDRFVCCADDTEGDKVDQCEIMMKADKKTNSNNEDATKPAPKNKKKLAPTGDGDGDGDSAGDGAGDGDGDGGDDAVDGAGDGGDDAADGGADGDGDGDGDGEDPDKSLI